MAAKQKHGLEDDERFAHAADGPDVPTTGGRKKRKLKIDPRFKGALDDERFGLAQGKVDKRGRKVDKNAQAESLAPFYELDDGLTAPGARGGPSSTRRCAARMMTVRRRRRRRPDGSSGDEQRRAGGGRGARLGRGPAADARHRRGERRGREARRHRPGVEALPRAGPLGDAPVALPAGRPVLPSRGVRVGVRRAGDGAGGEVRAGRHLRGRRAGRVGLRVDERRGGRGLRRREAAGLRAQEAAAVLRRRDVRRARDGRGRLRVRRRRRDRSDVRAPEPVVHPRRDDLRRRDEARRGHVRRGRTSRPRRTSAPRASRRRSSAPSTTTTATASTPSRRC